MTELETLLAANAAYASAGPEVTDARPGRRLAVLTCMDTRIDVPGALGLRLGEAHVLRNAGARVTEDVLRSLALSTHVLGVRIVVIMQHTRCGLAGTTDDELRRVTGAEMDFLPIDDHEVALRRDVEVVCSRPYLGLVSTVAGVILDVDSGELRPVVTQERGAP